MISELTRCIVWYYCCFERCGHYSHPVHNRLQCWGSCELHKRFQNTSFCYSGCLHFHLMWSPFAANSWNHLQCQLLTSPHWGKSFCVTLVLYGLSFKSSVAVWTEELDTTLWTANWQNWIPLFEQPTGKKDFLVLVSFQVPNFCIFILYSTEPLVWNASLFCVSFLYMSFVERFYSQNLQWLFSVIHFKIIAYISIVSGLHYICSVYQWQ
jgi:hypothetical protein